MTSRIALFHLDILNILNSIKDENLKSTLFKYVNIYDDQIDEMILGDNYSFNTPAAFIEFIPSKAVPLGAKVKSYPNSTIRLHLVNMLLDGGDNKMERNVEIFTIRDLVERVFNGTGKVRFCSAFISDEDRLDYKHGNIYKYVLSYNTNFIDTKGSVFDVDSGATKGFLVNPTITIPQLNMFGVDVYMDEESDTYYINE